MRLISFEYQGTAGYGLARDGGVVAAGRRLGGRYGDLKSVLAAGALSELHELERVAPDLDLAEIVQLPVIPNAAKILCVGINYLSHIKETGRDVPKYPVLFTRFADTFVGHEQPIVRPRVSTDLDYEGELAVIIGKPGRHIEREHALEHVAGYTCCNEGSVRDYQYHTIQFTAGKNFFHSGSLGPWLLTTDEQPDPTRFHLQTRINGTVLQDAPVSDLCFDIPQLIEYCSIWTPLGAGDIIVTGTPGGVGRVRKPPIWMRPGDVVEIDIRGIGTLRNTIVDETAD
ncbi:MAG TPA: fumarylacetoacetate hydrolase family protein [Gammaproteobacteria bacterium]|nr:fumarylacetoacetate hydrolase family protein [Gammaproteobacteria bacterium]